MPAFAAIALDRFLEPGSSKSAEEISSNSTSGPFIRSSSTKSIPRRGLENGSIDLTASKRFHSVPMSAAVYAPPELVPFADTPSSFPLSSYVRRGSGIIKTASRGNTSFNAINFIPVCESKGAVPPATFRNVEVYLDKDNEGMFFDPQESLSYTSNTDGEDNCTGECAQNTPMGEFYDAWEELSSGSGCSHIGGDMEAELREMRVCLLTEIGRRKQAEETLKSMQNLWQGINRGLSAVGLILPEVDVEHEQLSEDAAKDLYQQVFLTRHVSESIGKEVGRCEMEKEMGVRIELKTFEIARLCDQLRTYQAISHEMAQRNQEAMERSRELARKRRRRWIWGLVGGSLTFSVGVLAYSCLSTPESPQPESSEVLKTSTSS